MQTPKQMNRSHSESGQASMILLVLSSIFVTIKLIVVLSNCPVMINKIGTGESKVNHHFLEILTKRNFN